MMTLYTSKSSQKIPQDVAPSLARDISRRGCSKITCPAKQASAELKETQRDLSSRQLSLVLSCPAWSSGTWIGGRFVGLSETQVVIIAPGVKSVGRITRCPLEANRR